MAAPPPANPGGGGGRATLLAAIAAESGNFTRAAARLGIAKITLYERMKRFGINRLTLWSNSGPA